MLQVLVSRGAIDRAEAVRLRPWLTLRVLDRGRILQAEPGDDAQEREIAARLNERGIENLNERTLADMRRPVP